MKIDGSSTGVIDTAKGDGSGRRRIPDHELQWWAEKLGTREFIIRVRRDVEGREFRTIEVREDDLASMFDYIRRTNSLQRGMRPLTMREMKG